MNQPASKDLSAQIAAAIRDEILTGKLMVDARLPSEADLSDRFGVSRPTVREALKRLPPQSLIRTIRGATGGAFVNRLSFDGAYDQQVTTSTLLLSMNEIPFDVACEARFTLERACAPMAARRRTAAHMATLRAEIITQSRPDLSDEAFCASDVAFHRAFVDAAGNPVLSYQLAGAIEGMQPLMNMITFTARSRSVIIAHHTQIADALAAGLADAADHALTELMRYTLMLGRDMLTKRHSNGA